MLLFPMRVLRYLFEYPLITNSRKNAWRITKEKVEVLPISNHEETDQD